MTFLPTPPIENLDFSYPSVIGADTLAEAPLFMLETKRTFSIMS